MDLSAAHAVPREVRPQPQGLKGGRASLATLATLAVEAQDNINVRAWVSHLLHEEGLGEMDVSPAYQLKRAAAILRWVQTQVAWIPDPKNREHIPKPYLLLPCKDGTCDRLPFLRGDDCDGKDALLLALLLEALHTVDVPVAAIGHGYHPDIPVIEHVLAAVGSDPQWSKVYYLDPSTHLPFGECYPFEWEQVISLPDQRVVCDARICLGSSNMGQIIEMVGPSGGNVDVMHVVGRAPLDPVAWARARRKGTVPDPVAWARAQRQNRVGALPSPSVYRDALQADFDKVRQARDRFLVVVTEADRILASVGETALPGWGEKERTDAGRALAAVELAIVWLGQALAGERPVVVDPADPEDLWSLDGLPSDQVIVVGNQESFVLESRATGVQSAPVVAGRPVGLAPQTIGIILVAAAALGFVAIHAGALFLAVSVLNRGTEVVLKSLEAFTIQLYNRCLEKNPASACEKYVKAIGEARAAAGKAAAIERGARDKVTLDALSIGKWVLGITAATLLAIGVEKAYEKYSGSSRRSAPAAKSKKKKAA
jgi:hypothetical protein